MFHFLASFLSTVKHALLLAVIYTSYYAFLFIHAVEKQTPFTNVFKNVQIKALKELMWLNT